MALKTKSNSKFNQTKGISQKFTKNVNKNEDKHLEADESVKHIFFDDGDNGNDSNDSDSGNVTSKKTNSSKKASNSRQNAIDIGKRWYQAVW